MLPRAHRQEHLSKAYLRAVVAHAGYSCVEMSPDYGIDMQVQHIAHRAGSFHPTGHDLDVQVKSTTGVVFRDDHLVYDLKVKAYNQLVDPNRGRPAILVVYCMPEAEEDWLRVRREDSLLQHCGYWCSLKGRPTSENAQEQRVELPCAQIFDVAAVKGLMDRVFRGEDV